jgi:RNA polymerase sigma-70 factor (ECF subfamily)
MPDDFDAPSDAHQRIEESVEAASAARALSVLRPEQRRVLLLSIYHGMSHGEIVKTTGIPLGTVKSHIRRGLSEVRKKLKANVSDEEVAQ